MTLRLALRTAAIGIAIAGIVDPVATVARPAPQPLAISIVGAPADAAYDAAARVRTAVSDVFDVVVRSQPVATDASPCPDEGACVVVSDGVAPRRLSAHGPLGGIRVTPSRTPTVEIKSVTTPARTDPDARSVIRVAVDSKDPAPLVRVFDGTVLVGQATTGRIEWTPIARGLRDLRIATTDDEAHIAVDVAPQRHAVLFFESQPTWTGTFVRRALEADPRFALQTRARVASSITVSTGSAPLDVAALERADSRVVVVTAVEQLTAGEVAALDAFVTRRGGSVIALLDRSPSGPSRALLPFTMSERREPQPVEIAQLRASEFLTFSSLDAVTTSLAARGDEPVIVARPKGNGRLIASGASDAWRLRQDGNFDSFWQSLVADAADAAGDALTITLDKQLARPGEHVRVNVEWRPLRAIDHTIDARAALVCGSSSQPIRLWPSGAPGRFDAEFVAPEPADCRVTTTLNSVTGATPLMVREVRALGSQSDDLSDAIAAHGGTVVNAGDEGTLVTTLRRLASRRDISTQVHPMRSAFWIVPFAACLGAEWWIRRRTGRG
jgi:hypothetical protein